MLPIGRSAGGLSIDVQVVGWHRQELASLNATEQIVTCAHDYQPLPI